MPNTNNTPVVNPTTDEEVKDSSLQVGQKLLSQNEVNSIIQKRLDEETKKFNELKAKEIAEVERLAKLSADDREKELLAKSETERQERDKELTLRENKLEGIQKLAEAGLEISLIENVLTTDKEQMGRNIERLQSAFQKAVEVKVNERLKGGTPQSYDNNNNSNNISTPLKKLY